MGSSGGVAGSVAIFGYLAGRLGLKSVTLKRFLDRLTLRRFHKNQMISYAYVCHGNSFKVGICLALICR